MIKVKEFSKMIDDQIIQQLDTTLYYDSFNPYKPKVYDSLKGLNTRRKNKYLDSRLALIKFVIKYYNSEPDRFNYYDRLRKSDSLFHKIAHQYPALCSNAG